MSVSHSRGAVQRRYPLVPAAADQAIAARHHRWRLCRITLANQAEIDPVDQLGAASLSSGYGRHRLL